MKETFKDIFTSRAVWTAILAFASALIGYYTAIPEEVWIPFVALLTAIFIKFTVNDLGYEIGRSMGRALRGLDKED